MEMEVHEEMERSREDIQALKNDLETLRADLARLLNTLKGAAKVQMSSARNRLWESTKDFEDQAQSRINTAYDSMCQRGQRARAMATETVEQRPLTMLAGAFAAGIFFASLMRRH